MDTTLLVTEKSNHPVRISLLQYYNRCDVSCHSVVVIQYNNIYYYLRMYRNTPVGREGLGPGPTLLTRFCERTVNHHGGGGLENNINVLIL